jgi:hypothetical protein
VIFITILFIYLKIFKEIMTRRCDNCNKKVSLISFECKCKLKTLCSKCKLPKYHSCKSLEEFKTEAKEIINKNNQVLISDKLIKI